MPITLIAHTLILRDRLIQCRGTHSSHTTTPSSPIEKIHIPVQSRRLTASLHRPLSTPQSAVLIFHGIGECLLSWHGAQQLLAQHAITSLVFAYSGYPHSTGATTPENLHQDALAAYAALSPLIPPDTPIFLLGLSLGTGIATAVAPELLPPPAGIILCQPFTSLRDAAHVLLRSRVLARLLPDLYPTEAAIAAIAIPLLIVHADGDRLFPTTMGHRIHAAAATHPHRLVHIAIPRGLAHNDAFRNPTPAYWQAILDFMRNPITHPSAPR